MQLSDDARAYLDGSQERLDMIDLSAANKFNGEFGEYIEDNDAVLYALLDSAVRGLLVVPGYKITNVTVDWYGDDDGAAAYRFVDGSVVLFGDYALNPHDWIIAFDGDKVDG